MTRLHEKAIAHVAELADGGPGDPGWRVTLHGDASRTGRYDEQALKRVWHYVARFGTSELAS
jgi:hypothetical protein